MKSLSVLLLVALLGAAHSFAPARNAATLAPPQRSIFPHTSSSSTTSSSLLSMMNDDQKKFGGYTVKQRLREEVESPFRTVRLYFFGFSTVSAFVALYFSLLTLLKSYSGFTDAPPMNDSLESVGINVAAVTICGYLSYRDWQAGEANLKRIAKGGALAKLVVTDATNNTPTPLADYRRKQRILICAGGKDYVEKVCRSLNADQLKDTNTIPDALFNSEVVVVPVLLKGNGTRVGDTSLCWKETMPNEDDRNFDTTRADQVVAFPRGNAQWQDYLESEVQTATKQGFNVINKGFIIVVKKNGKILRRATGLPPWSDLVGTMEVLDGSKFGMPGDDEKYYGSS